MARISNAVNWEKGGNRTHYCGISSTPPGDIALVFPIGFLDWGMTHVPHAKLCGRIERKKQIHFIGFQPLSMYLQLKQVNCIFSFLVNLLGWHWLTKFCRFQAHDSITHHLYTVLYVHHPKSSPHPSLFIPPHTLLPFPSCYNHFCKCDAFSLLQFADP